MPGKTNNMTGAAPTTPVREGAALDGLRVDRLICVELAALTLVVFGQSVGFDFVNFDDGWDVYDNPLVAGGLTLHGLAVAFTQGSQANWDPLTIISHMVDCQIFGLHAGGHHLTNVLLHTMSVVLLFVVLRQMTGARWRSAFATAVFAIHPLRAESVAWVAERKDVLSGLFFMLTLWAYIRYVRQPKEWKRYMLVVLFFGLGLMAKSMLVTLPFILLLLDYWPLGRFGGMGLVEQENSQIDLAPGRPAFRALLIEKLPLLVLAAGLGVVAMWAQGRGNAVQSFAEFPFRLRLINALDSVVMYLAQMFYPANLAVFYPYPEHGLPLWRTGVELLAVFGISVAAWRGRRERPYLLTGWLWYLVMLGPVIGLIQIGDQARADRYTYLPQIGLYVALSWWGASWLPGWRQRGTFLRWAAVAAVAGLSVCAFLQTSHWRNSVQLWQHCLAVTPPSALACQNYGLALMERKQFDEALTQFQRAAELKSDFPDAHDGAGSVLAQTGRVEEAVAEFKLAVAGEPADPLFHSHLAAAFAQDKHPDDAIGEYRKVLELAPDFPDAEGFLGYLLFRKGQLDDAIVHLQRAVRLQPARLNVRYTLATALLQRDRLDEAVSQFQAALAIQPDFAGAREGLEDIAWRLATSPDAAARNGAKAVGLARALVQANGGAQPVFLRTLAAALAETGKYAEAATMAEQARSLAERAGDQATVAQLQDQLAHYRVSQPFRDTNLVQPESWK